VESIDEQWDTDLISMVSFAKYNDDFKYILLCIDTLSKFIWLEPLKNKTAIQMKAAFQKIFSGSERKCLRIRSDKGSEYTNGVMKAYFKHENIIHFVTYNSTKACIAERSIRTIKQRLFKYLTHKQTNRYIDIIQHLADNYNSSYHRSIKMAPISVNEANQQQVWENIYGGDIFSIDKKSQETKFKIGDIVRMSFTRDVFSRGYNEGWSHELFIITTINNTSPLTYRLKDFADDKILGTVYGKEISKVVQSENPTYKIEKTLRRRKVNGTQQYLVKWAGWPDKFNSWVSAADMTDL
jgi:hypothetical protein